MIQFGTGGWRAIIGDGFTKENIQLLASAMAEKMIREQVQEKGICISYDRRFLAKEAVQWACEVFAARGIPCLFIHRSSPTPLVMYYVMAHHLPYGMMVTASHNPAIYNGIKIFTEEGRDAEEEQTREIERYVSLAEKEKEKGKPPAVMPYEEALEKGLVKEFNPINEYLDNIIRRIQMERIRDAGLRVALDPMYGVSQTSLKTILPIARCELEVIHERHDTLFGGKLPAPNAETMRSLQNYVTDRHCDIGIATDGDADRIGVIDDQGNFLHPNDILVLLYYYLLKYKGWMGPAVRNVATTHLLDRVAEHFDQRCYEVPVGFKYISAKMQETDALIGGESSGGLTVRGHINGKDGIYAAVLLVEMIAVTGKKTFGIDAGGAGSVWQVVPGRKGLPSGSWKKRKDSVYTHGGETSSEAGNAHKESILPGWMQSIFPGWKLDYRALFGNRAAAPYFYGNRYKRNIGKTCVGI